MDVLEVRNLRKTYEAQDSEGAPVRALRGADMRIHGLVLWDAEMPQLETREEMLGATRESGSFQPELATAH